MSMPHLLYFALCFYLSTSRDADTCDGGLACTLQQDDLVSLLQLTSSPTAKRRLKREKGIGKENHWSRRGRDEATSSFTPHTAPSNFSAGPSWVWKNELDEQVRHSPLIDGSMNIYVTTATRIRKFSPKGIKLWTWESSPDDGIMVSCPALYEEAVVAVTGGSKGQGGGFGATPTMYSISMTDGSVSWKKRTPSLTQNQDASSVFVYNSTIIVPMMTYDTKAGGNTVLYAVNSSDGSYLWNYTADDALWNFSPSTPGDGSLLFATSCGGVYRISFGGDLVWRKGTPGTTPEMGPGVCSTGGGALGPNGVFYIEYNEGLNVTTGAHVQAYNVSDGAMLWSKILSKPYGGWQYPAVGKLSADGPLAVVVAAGGITGEPNLMTANAKPLQRDERLRNAVIAMDASSGKEIWRFEEEPWKRNEAAGDVAKLADRVAQAKSDPRRDQACVPDVQGIPLIAGDGVVYASSGHTGELRAIRDKDGNGIIDANEVSLFSTGQCFLNSPSLAPGMLVAAPCWGPMYVFKDEKQ